MILKHSLILFIYNRPKFTIKLLKSLKNFKFKKIYIIADGPKQNDKDKIMVNATRLIIDKYFNTKVIKLYSNQNLGSKKRV